MVYDDIFEERKKIRIGKAQSIYDDDLAEIPIPKIKVKKKTVKKNIKSLSKSFKRKKKKKLNLFGFFG